MSERTRYGMRVIDGVGLGVCLVLSLAVYALAVSPALEARAERRADKAELARLQQEAAELENQLSERRAVLQQTERAVAARSLDLQPRSGLNERLARITDVADACGVALDQIEPGQPVSGEHYVTVPLHLSGRGGYTTVAKMLRFMHRDWPDLAVASLDLQARPRQPADEPRFTLELLWFAAPDG